ncbi:SDR family NAD(P)-dependent oxidoreductase [Cytobacillus sp. IB215665]|uniref:SDR family NAD(P)-dependent oxidoreductase n=1 Tax=Cytobacillus sp. IB215665 TaxID=3097357 RepID=UPI002A12BB5D|nr:SDR family NAD(P)-dependent oxidoreductase [Cytobacillus sp. IB215665]MDX8366625.1 SDR family oxidoreductase [Cytobacillus sp. IB215665]
MKMLENQVAIITGSGRGVGRQVAELMAEHGARVVVSDKDQEPAEEVVSAIKEKGGDAISVNGDVTSSEFPKQIMDETIQAYGKLDILVNNAGYTWDGMIHKMTDEQFQAMIDIHLFAPFRLIREATPYLRNAHKDDVAKGVDHYRKIVNVTSVAGVMGNVGQANYSSAKAGLIGLTKTVAREWAPFHVNCNAVAFGMVETRLTQPKEKGESVNGVTIGIPENMRQMIQMSIPQQRAGTALEAAQSIFYLASPLSNYVNGQVLNVNGGFYS